MGPLTLPRALAAAGTDDFAFTLQTELAASLWKLPLETLCRSGGWPHPDGHFSLSDIRIEQRPDALVVDCMVSFEEIVPSCCSGGTITDHHTGKMAIRIDKGSGEAGIAVAEI